MSTQFNDQWILNRINAGQRKGGPKALWATHVRRSRKAGWTPPLSTQAIRVLDKHPRWIDRDM